MNKMEIEKAEYEMLRTKINEFHRIIGNIQLLLNTIGNSDICPYCRSKINVNTLKREYNKRKIDVNKLDKGIQYLNIEEDL